MGKKRHTVKTGDRSIYKSRGLHNKSDLNENNDDDAMYNEVDRFNNAHDELQDDMLRFNKDEGQAMEEDETRVENVFDLGLDGSDSEEDEEEEDYDSESTADKAIDSKDGMSSSSTSEEEYEDEDAGTDILDWGKKKRDYYHGDTADLEIGQEIEDAEVEEKAGREVLRARMEEMTEDDFRLDIEDEDDSNNQKALEQATVQKKVQKHSLVGTIQSKKRKNLATLSKRDKIKLLKKTHPELLPIVSYFREEVIRPCAEETLVATNALFRNTGDIEAVGATPAGLQYLICKAMIQTSSALNLCQYLLIKADYAKEEAVTSSVTKSETNESNDLLSFDIQEEEGDKIRNHPVINRLNQLNTLSEKLKSDVESNVKGLKYQMESLVKASTLMKKTNEDNKDKAEANNLEVEDTDATEASSKPLHEQSSMDDQDMNTSYSSSSSEEEEDAIAIQRRIMTEARFSLRPDDDNEFESEAISHDSKSLKRRRRAPLPSFLEIGDENDDDAQNRSDITAAGRALASTINSISQRNRSKNNMKTRVQPEMEDNDIGDERLLRGLEMMEAEVGKDDGNDDVSDAELDDSLNNDEDGDENDFYSNISKRSKKKKQAKKELYAVAPKYPRLDEETDGERAIGRIIMKNRGLVAHKAKINRNPRVKKREQYRKALIRRKGAVREVITGEGHKYGGEVTGIKSNLSRSRKL